MARHAAPPGLRLRGTELRFGERTYVMGIVNALLVPFLAHAFGWTFAIASGAGFALLGLIFMLLVRADQPID